MVIIHVPAFTQRFIIVSFSSPNQVSEFHPPVRSTVIFSTVCVTQTILFREVPEPDLRKLSGDFG